MRFAEPLWLLAGLAALAALVGLYLRFDSRQRRSLAEFASSHLLERLTSSFSPVRRLIKRTLFTAAVGFIFVALARPQIGYHWEEEKQRGIDILFAIDTSKSMLTQDVVPDRLTRAKLAITDFVNKLGTDRVGLIAFAGDAFLQAPLTLDYDAFEESLDAVDTNVIPRGGTDIATAIQEGEAAFGPDVKNRKILVLITDGEDIESKGIDAAKAAGQKGLTIYTVGVGTAAGGLIPVPGENSGTEFVKDPSTGEIVKSHLDESTLKQIAQVTGGIYVPLGQHGEGLDSLYNQALAALPKQDVLSRRDKVYDERFQWPLGLGLALLIASMLIGTRRREVKNEFRAPTTSRAVATAACIMALALAGMSSAQASPQSAEKAYKSGNYDDAEDQYEDAAEAHPNDARIQFNMGDAAYQAGDFDKALPAFQKALGTDQVGLQQQTYYNIGNTDFRVGEKTEAKTPDDTIKQWQAAVDAYDAALKLKPDDADAKYNREFVEKKLEKLQKQQQQQKKNQDKQDQGQNGNSDSKQNTSQGAGKQQKPGTQQEPDKQQGNNGSQQDQSGGTSSGPQPSASQGDPANGQNGQDQQKPGSQQAQNAQPSQSGQNGQPNDQQQGQTAGNQGNSSQDKGQQQAGNQGNPAQDKGQQQAGNQGNPSQDKGQQPSGAGDQNSQMAQGQQPSANGQSGAGKNGSSQQVAGGDMQPATPGVLSRDEARELLNSLKNNEHALPVTADARTANRPQADKPLKDW